MTELDVAGLRKLFPVLENATYLNPGTYGPVPTPVADAIRDWFTMLEQVGPWAPPAVKESMDAYEGTREKVAALLGADSDEIALTRSVSDGADIVAFGLEWKPGDEIIMSNQEHESSWVNWKLAAKRFGLEIKVIDLSEDEERMLSLLDEAMTDRTRLVFLSHLSCQSGLVIPAKAVTDFVHQRGALMFLDGAHTAGQMPVDVHELGCDFYIGCGHKWIMAPQGTGFFYVREELLCDIEPTMVGWGSRSKECTGPGDERLLWAEGGRRYEYSTRPWPLYAAFGAAIDLINEIGVENIYQHVQGLVTPFKAELAKLPNMTVKTPSAPGTSAGIVALQAEGYDHDVLSKLYDEKKIMLPYNRRPNGTQWMRFAVAYFILPSELEMMLDILKECAPKA
jgi:selenocysteine lyase/cysteine desulfurase